jgi:hypothetical protein
VLRSHKDFSLAEHAEDAEKKRHFKRFPSRLRVLARDMGFLPFEETQRPILSPRRQDAKRSL